MRGLKGASRFIKDHRHANVYVHVCVWHVLLLEVWQLFLTCRWTRGPGMACTELGSPVRVANIAQTKHSWLELVQLCLLVHS